MFLNSSIQKQPGGDKNIFLKFFYKSNFDKNINYLFFKDFCVIGNKLFLSKNQDFEGYIYVYLKYIQLSYVNFICLNVIGFLIYYYYYLLKILKINIYIYKKKILLNFNLKFNKIFFYIKFKINMLSNLLKLLRIFIKNFLYLKSRFLIFKNLILLFFNFLNEKFLINNSKFLCKLNVKLYYYNIYIYKSLYENKVKFFSYKYFYKNIYMILVFYFFFKKFLLKNKINNLEFNKLFNFNWLDNKIIFNFYKIIILYKIKKFMKNYFYNFFNFIYKFYNKKVKILKYKNFKIFMFLFKNLLIFFDKTLYNVLSKKINKNLIFIFNKIKLICFYKFFFVERFMFNNFFMKLITKEIKYKFEINELKNINNFIDICSINKYKNNKIWYYLFNNIYISKNLIYFINLFSNKNYFYLKYFFEKLDINENKLINIKDYENFNNLNFFNLIEFFEKLNNKKFKDLYFIKNKNFLLFNFFYKFLNMQKKQIYFNNIYDFYKVFIIKELFLLVYLKFFPKKHAYEFYDKVFDILDDYDYNDEIIKKSKYKYNEYNSKVLETYNYLPKIDGFKDYYEALLDTFDFSFFIKKKFNFNFFINKDYKNMLHFFTRPSSEFGLFPIINLYKINNLSKHLKNFDLEDFYKKREFFQDWIYMKKSIEKLNLFSIFDIFSNKNSNILNLKDFLDFEILKFFFQNKKMYLDDNLAIFINYYVLYHKLFLKKIKYKKLNYKSFLIYINKKWNFLYNIYNNEKDFNLMTKYKLKAQFLFKENFNKKFVFKYNNLLNKFFLIKNKFNFFKYNFFYKLINIPFIFNYSFEFFENQKNYIYRKFFKNNYLFFNLNSSDFFTNLQKDFFIKKFKYSETDLIMNLKNKNELIYFFDLYYMNLLLNQSFFKYNNFFFNTKVNKLNLFFIYKLFIYINKYKNLNNSNIQLLKIYNNNLTYVFDNFLLKKNVNKIILNIDNKKIFTKKRSQIKNFFNFFFLINFFKIYLNYYYKFLLLNNYLLKEYQLILPNIYKYGFLNKKLNFLTFDLNMRFKFIFLGDYLNFKHSDALDLYLFNKDIENNLDDEDFLQYNYFEKKQHRSLENLNFLARYNWPTFDDFINIPYDWAIVFCQIQKTNFIYYKIQFFFLQIIQFIFKRKIKFFDIKYIGTLYYDGFIWFEYFFLLKYNFLDFINYFTLNTLFFPIFNIFFEIFYTFQSYYYDFDYYHIYDNVETFEEIHTNYYDFLLGNFYFDYSPFSLINSLDESDALIDETGEFNYFLTSNEFVKRQNDDFIKDLLYGHDLFFDYEIFESLGFNGSLLDEDFQYIININDLFIFFSSGILKFQEVFIFLFKYSLFYYNILKNIYLNFKYSGIYLFFKFFVKLISIPFLIIIFIYLYIIYISCVVINILILSLNYLKFNYKILFNLTIFSNLIFYINFIIIFIFFFLRKIFVALFFYLYNYFQFKKNLFYINVKIFEYLKIFFFKLFYILIFFLYRILLIYIFFIFFFLNYDNIYLFFEKIFYISIDVRSFSLIYIYLFFFLVLLLFNPFTKMGNLIWSIRYEILGLSIWFWWLSGYINSIDIFLFYFWSNIHLLLSLNFNNADFFIPFYESVISPWNQGLPELQVKFFDFWYDWIVENKNEFIDLLNIFDFFHINPLIYKYTRYCYKFFVKEYFIIYNFFNVQLSNFFYDLSNKYMYYFYDRGFNFKLYFFPFFISFRVLNELCVGDAYYFINLFKDFFFFRYQGLAEGNLLYYKLYYKLNNFEYIEFLKNNLNCLYIDMWGGYKPKNSHLINFYYRNEYVYTEGNTEWFLESAEADRAVVGYVDPVRYIDLQYRPNKWWAKKPEFVNDFLRYTKFHHVRYKQYKYVAYTPWRFYNQDYSAYFNKILLPDLAFIGGSQWFYDPDLFQYTHTIKDDGIILLGGRFISSEYEY